VLDIRVNLDNGEICNIEMQVVQQKNIEKRILYYWSKLYASGIKQGQDYEKLHKTIVILIANFEIDIIKDIPKYHTKWEIREEEYSKKILTDMLEIDIIELTKLTKELNKNNISKNDKVALWAKFIINPEMIGVKEMSENEDIRKANEELEKIQDDEYEQYLAHLRLKHIMDTKAVEAYGYDKGIEEGIKQAKKEAILNMYKKKIKIEDICNILTLNKEDVKKIIREENQ